MDAEFAVDLEQVALTPPGAERELIADLAVVTAGCDQSGYARFGGGELLHVHDRQLAPWG